LLVEFVNPNLVP